MATLRLLGLLCAAAFAGEITPSAVRLPSVPALYAPPAVEWSRPLPSQTAIPLESALARVSGLGIQVPTQRADLSAADRLQALAPVVAQLQHLGLDANAFAVHSAQEQDAALEMALTDARADVTHKAYELVARAKILVWSENGYDKAKRDELYTVAAQLGELKDHYLELVPAEERDFVAQSELQARARFHDVWKSLVDGTALPSAEALLGRTSPSADRGAVETSASRRSPGTSTAVALLERMKATKSGWGQKDMDALYRGYGFVMEEGGNHRKYYHPKYPQLWTMVARHNDLAPGYAQTAVKLIAELERLDGPALPASAIAGETVVPPLPKPSAPAVQKRPEAIAEAVAPLEPEPAAAAPKKKEKRKPTPARAEEPKPAPATTLQPATPREAAPKTETPAPATPAPKYLPEPYGWLEKVRRLLGF